MHSNEPVRRTPSLPPARLGGLIALLLFAVSGWLWLHLHTVHAQENKKLTIYSPQATYSVAVTENDGHDYVGIFEVFEPLGGIELKPNGEHWILKVDTSPRITEGIFTPGIAEALIHGKPVALSAPVIADNEHILVSVTSLPALLSAFIDAKTVLHAPGRRLFVNLTGLSIWQELKSGDPNVPESKSHVVLTFPSAVNPTLFESGNQLHMLFTREPVLPGSDITFTDPAIREIRFQENNGSQEVIATGTVPLAASLIGSGKQITITASHMPIEMQGSHATPAMTPEQAILGTPQDTSTQGSLPQENGTSSSTAQSSSGQGSSMSVGPIPVATVLPKLVIVIDPGHGGSDPGARIGTMFAEKDIVLAVAHKLRTELQNRGFTTLMARDGDGSISGDQRATLANATHPALYMNLHANATETGVHVYTSLLKPATPIPVFPTWDTAQAGYVERSQHIASMIADSLNQSTLIVSQGHASLRPLDNIAAPAIAVEFSPQGGGAEQITETGYQENLARSLANALEANRLEL